MQKCNRGDCPFNQSTNTNANKASHKEKGNFDNLQSKVKTLIKTGPDLLKRRRGFDTIMMYGGMIVTIVSIIGAASVSVGNATANAFGRTTATNNDLFYYSFLLGALYWLIGYLGGKFWPDTPPPPQKKEKGNTQRKQISTNQKETKSTNTENTNNMSDNTNKYKIILPETLEDTFDIYNRALFAFAYQLTPEEKADPNPAQEVWVMGDPLSNHSRNKLINKERSPLLNTRSGNLFFVNDHLFYLEQKNFVYPKIGNYDIPEQLISFSLN